MTSLPVKKTTSSMHTTVETPPIFRPILFVGLNVFLKPHLTMPTKGWASRRRRKPRTPCCTITSTAPATSIEVQNGAVRRFRICDRGPSRVWGSGGNRRPRVCIVGWMEFLSAAGTEGAIVDSATGLEQEIGPSSRPAHCCDLTMRRFTRNLAVPLGDRGPNPQSGTVALGVIDRPVAPTAEKPSSASKAVHNFLEGAMNFRSPCSP
jgi:hypothetical protein